jgi:cyanophycin synthetase
MQTADYTHVRGFKMPKCTAVLREICEKLRIQLEIIDKEQGYLVRLTEGNNSVVTQSNYITINRLAAAKITQDKVYTYRVLKRAGVRVPQGSFFLKKGHFVGPDYSEGQGLLQARKFADWLATRVGYPLIVKPNHLSAGLGVTRVDNSNGVIAAVKKVFRLEEHNAIVQEYIRGREYRLVVLKGRVVLCYERLLPAIRGDGGSSVRTLINRHNGKCPARARLDLHNANLLKLLKKQGLSPRSVPRKGKQIIVNETTTNLARGGRLKRVRELHRSFDQWAKTVCGGLGLSFGAIDLRTADIAKPANLATVLEVNANPSLVHSYRKMRDKTVVINVYRVLLRDLLKQCD